MLSNIFSTRSSRWLRRTLLCACVCLVVTCAVSSAAFSKTTGNNSTPVKVLNVHVGGYMDPQNESLIFDTLKSAQKNDVSLYVLQLDSDGIAGANIHHIAQKFAQANFVVAIWVGPTSATYSDQLAPLIKSADFIGAADKSLAKKMGAHIVAPSLREFFSDLDQRNVARLNYTLDTGCSVKEVRAQRGTNDACANVKLSKNENFALNIAPQFEKLSPVANLGHSLIKPGFAVGLLVMGLFLLAFEFFAASVGVSAVAGTIAGLCGVYGLGYLPTHWWAVGVVVLGVAAMVIDVQAGGVGLYTCLGTLLILFGSYFATDRTGTYGVSIVSAVIITIMALLFAVGAIPSLIRTRFGTPTIGREDFIGDEGVADGDIDPDGSVKLRGGSWKARTNHATPIKDGEKCRIIKIEGIVLEVEPLVGAAIDHREKRVKKN